MGKIELSDMQMSALKEVANIGSAHASNSLSQMINRNVGMSVPKAEFVILKDVPEKLGLKNEIVGIVFKLTEEFKSCLLILMPKETSLIIADMLLCMDIGSTTELDEMGRSAVTEVGNVMASAYTRALGEFFNIQLLPSKQAREVIKGYLSKVSGYQAEVIEGSFGTSDYTDSRKLSPLRRIAGLYGDAYIADEILKYDRRIEVIARPEDNLYVHGYGYVSVVVNWINKSKPSNNYTDYF